MWSMTRRQRSLLTKIVLLLLYGISFAVLRGVLRLSAVRGRLPEIPSMSLHKSSPYNESKVALLIENRPSSTLAPLLLHFMAVVPEDWKFRFMGTIESVGKINGSAPIQQQVRTGRLDLTYIPEDLSTAGQEAISGFLTNPRVIELLRPAEWVLVFQTDSMVCAQHQTSIDEWLEYSWVGAPWTRHSTYGGNGGLSLRRVSAMAEVLRHQHRENNSEPEDVWLTERIAHLPGAKMATGLGSMKFSVEQIWYEYPLGYHIGGSGSYLFQSVWAKEEHRLHMWDYCPELKMTLDMDVLGMMDICEAEYVPNNVD